MHTTRLQLVGDAPGLESALLRFIKCTRRQTSEACLKLQVRHCCSELVCMLVSNQCPIDAKHGVNNLRMIGHSMLVLDSLHAGLIQ